MNRRTFLAKLGIGAAATAVVAVAPVIATAGRDADPTNPDQYIPTTFAEWRAIPGLHVAYMARDGWELDRVERISGGFQHHYRRGSERMESVGFYDRTPENWQRMRRYYSKRRA